MEKVREIFSKGFDMFGRLFGFKREEPKTHSSQFPLEYLELVKQVTYGDHYVYLKFVEPRVARKFVKNFKEFLKLLAAEGGEEQYPGLESIQPKLEDFFYADVCVTNKYYVVETKEVGALRLGLRQAEARNNIGRKI